ncbi:MAG TPA: FecR family protein [Candidatus Omnitrophota bacterium]|nr:FecR family protein [Candidatus Omnitrophota bacterium]HPD84849.1 FecR family protein [Candidatus Omnitrophota bacterium]HRZ03707.1 FecR family protein [Candidatus Omnitrophota bacterium]
MRKYQALVLCMALFFGVIGTQRILNAAEIVYVEGNVQVQSPVDNIWKKAEKGMKVDIGDLIRTARHSVAEVALDPEKKNMIRVEPKTLVALQSSTEESIDRLDLSRGKVYSNLEGIKAGLSFEVSTPSAVAGVRGSSYSVYVERDADEVYAYKDTVFIKTYDVDKNEISETMLPEGFKTLIERFEAAGALMQISTREFDNFDGMMEDLSANVEGRMSNRAQIEAERRERQETKQEEKSALEQQTDQTSEEGGVIEEVIGTQEDIEDRNTEERLDEIGGGGGHEH